MEKWHTMKRTTAGVLLSLLVAVVSRSSHSFAEPGPGQKQAEAKVVAAVEASLRLLQASSAAFQKEVKGSCYSCHNESLPAMAVALARDRGFQVEEAKAREQRAYVHRRFASGREKALQALGNPAGKDRDAEDAVLNHFPGADMTIGYGLLGMAAWDPKPDPATQALARFLARRQRKEGRWGVSCSVRAPSEDSNFTATALAVRAMQTFIPGDAEAEVEQRVASARRWLQETAPQNTEDRTFRLLGLAWAGAAKTDSSVQETVRALLADQREDGGWAQTAALPSDAYATGEVLVALHQAGGLPVTDPAYQRGAAFLLQTQAKDGSWFVKSRARPFQGYVETGFPYGKNQFISAAATSWATMALTLIVPPGRAPAPRAVTRKPTALHGFFRLRTGYPHPGSAAPGAQ
jgi:hypothetical protein